MVIFYDPEEVSAMASKEFRFWSIVSVSDLDYPALNSGGTETAFESWTLHDV